MVMAYLHPGCRQGSSREWCNLDRIEMCDAVGFGPQRDFAGLDEGLVGRGEQHLAVERDREAIALGTECQGVPLLCRNLCIRPGNLDAPAFTTR
jgi:hypothetical protein